jgi:hypothetical protein
MHICTIDSAWLWTRRDGGGRYKRLSSVVDMPKHRQIDFYQTGCNVPTDYPSNVSATGARSHVQTRGDRHSRRRVTKAPAKGRWAVGGSPYISEVGH